MKQITILSGGQKDPIGNIMRILADADVNIDSITGEHYNTQAVVTITTVQQGEAIKAIEAHEGYQVLSEDILLVRVNDKRGALAEIAQRFSSAAIDIRSIRFVERHGDYALVAISTTRTAEALDLVSDILVS